MVIYFLHRKKYGTHNGIKTENYEVNFGLGQKITIIGSINCRVQQILPVEIIKVAYV